MTGPDDVTRELIDTIDVNLMRETDVAHVDYTDEGPEVTMRDGSQWLLRAERMN